MDDSDDYLFDDFVLDEQIVAALDQAEKTYQESLSKSNSRRSEPVNKRHKTDNGWTAGLGSTNGLDIDDFEDLPEISVREDGTYSIRSITTKQNSVPRPKAREAHTISVPPVGSSSSRPINTKPLISHHRPALPSKAAVQLQGPVTKTNERQSELENELKELQKNLEKVSTSPHSFISTRLTQFYKLREENAKVQTALKNAVEIRMTKEGEVSILRKNIETVSVLSVTLYRSQQKSYYCFRPLKRMQRRSHN